MKFCIVATLAALSGAHVQSNKTCRGCPPHSPAPDVATRSPLPTPSCAEPALTVVPNNTATVSSGVAKPTGATPSGTPFAVLLLNGASGSMIVNAGGVLAVAAAVVGYML
ncbi:hypothetical protein B0J13DRAFT_524706 [Dactylonectria estremocensis]|uniref:Uncharacterized protein n=1 Tax=Dactylonectria estremocensis TaxID=1079267 RepID=A0A9P9J4N5_9HYPO|nr:hypothetical protein B0J13DRAFT_524706 [Dactylonectria estremocensis]